MSSHRGRQTTPEGLNADSLTTSALNHLRHGRWQAAADIFAGLVALRPTDGDAWNNLGFCQLPGDIEQGLRSLQQASLYKRQHAFLNTVNRTLALHLLGRDSDALRISETALATDQQPPAAALWLHDSEQQLTIADIGEPRAYLVDLRHHITLGGCCT
jgi:lipoprotein NlpI